MKKEKIIKSICIDARMIENAGIGRYLKSLLKGLANKKTLDAKIKNRHYDLIKDKEKNSKEKNNIKKISFKISLIVKCDILKRLNWLKTFDLIYLDALIYSIKEQFLLPLKIPKCDLFFSPHFNVPILPIRAKKRLVTIHDVYHLAHISKLSFFEKIYAKYFICKAALQSDKIITVSNFSKSEIIKYTKAKDTKIQVIHNAIESDLFKIEKDEFKILKIIDKFNLPQKYFLFVGNLKPHKNLLNLVKAFEKLIQDFKDVYLVIVGKNDNLINAIDLQNILEKKNNLKKRVIFIDNALDDDLPYVYSRAISLVFPSYYEGFGYPPIEAMSLKCPVIASNVASLPEICQNAASFVDPNNSKSIYNAMKQMILDESYKNDLIKKGLKRVKDFTMQNFINKHINQFNELLDL